MRRDHQSTELTRAHDRDADFEVWPRAAIYSLRALAQAEPGAWMDTEEVEEASSRIGRNLHYASARGGIRFLVASPHDWKYRNPERVPAAEEGGYRGRRGRAVQRLTEEGWRLAARSFEIFPLGQEDGEVAERPPDPVTPLWRVLHDAGEVLVIAATAPAAMILFEQETGEDAHRAEAVDTAAPMVLDWTARPPSG